MSDASIELQRAILAKLLEAPAIAGGKVYDDVPAETSKATAPDSAFPYVHLGEVDAVPDDTSSADGGDDGEQETHTLHVWSRYRGKKEMLEIMQRIKDRLHQVALTVAGRASANSFVTVRRNFMDPDGKTRHGVISVQVIHRKS